MPGIGVIQRSLCETHERIQARPWGIPGPFSLREGAVLPLRVIESIALRYDTVMSRAMLRALGVVVRPERKDLPKASAKLISEAKYQGMEWCFENHGSPCL